MANLSQSITRRCNSFVMLRCIISCPVITVIIINLLTALIHNNDIYIYTCSLPLILYWQNDNNNLDYYMKQMYPLVDMVNS